MDQNQTLNSDLQKAIDDITSATSVDPVFSDPVAAPSSVPEGDDGAMGEAVGPFPTPEPVMQEPPVMENQMPEPVMTPEPMPEVPPMPEINMPPIPAMEDVYPQVNPMPEAPVNMPEIAPAPEPPRVPEMAYTPVPEVAPVMEDNNLAPQSMHQVREAALRDLAPLLAKMSINPSQKFRIYRDMFEDLHDYAVLAPAYRAAKEIADDNERGEALLYLVESIDRI